MTRFAYLDIEASHTNWLDARIIEIAFIIKDEKGEDLDFFQSLIKPTRKIEENISELTGITQKMLDEAPEFHEVAQKIKSKIEGCVVVAHKAEFDLGLLQKAFESLQIIFKPKPICTLELTQRLIPELRSYSLKSLCEMLQIKLPKHHRALEDATALAHLHHYLRLINGELNESKTLLPLHEKLVDKTPRRPGIITIKHETGTEYFKTENLSLRLKELLTIAPKNRHRISSHTKIEIHQTASLVRAGLLKSRIEKPYYPYCIYQVKTKEGKIHLRVGKTDLKKKAIYFTKTRAEALKIVRQIIHKDRQVKFAYKDDHNRKEEILKENIQLQSDLKNLVSLEKNYLIRSTELINGKYQYTVVRGRYSYAHFESTKKIRNSSEIRFKSLKFKPIGPREFMALNHSLKWIKNQKQKTDLLFEIKKHH